MKKNIKNFALLIIIVTGLIAGTNKLINAFSKMNDSLPMGKGKLFNWKYGMIYYTKSGSGKPLLLVHDLNVCSSSYEWSRVVKNLSKSYTVYTIDLLGCGRSDKPNITYTNYMYVQLINDFIKKIIGSKTNVAATGDSFPFIIMACHINSENFDKIIGVSPCDLYDLIRTPGKRKKMLKYILELPILGTFIYNLRTSKKRIAFKVASEYYYRGHHVPAGLINAYHKAAKNEEGRGKYLLASIKSRYTNINIIPAIEKINNSICLVGGRENPLINYIIDEYKEHNSSIEDAYISETNYLPQLESPEKFAELIRIIL